MRNFQYDATRKGNKEIKGMQALTPREREVINYVAQGKSNKFTAIELGLSMRTVETHRARIFRKMEVRNATELARRVYAPHLSGHVPVSALHEPEAELDPYHDADSADQSFTDPGCESGKLG